MGVLRLDPAKGAFHPSRTRKKMVKSLNMKRIIRAARRGLARAVRGTCVAAFCCAGLAFAAQGADVSFGGRTVSYTGAETNWVDGELVLVYTNTQTAGSLTLPAYTKARLLVVAGGGAGASPANATAMQGGAGGGGAGGLIAADDVLLASGDYTLTVGAGGAAGTDTEVSEGKDGGDSVLVFGSSELHRAFGGGGGGIKSAGRDGGSGGGGSKPGSGGSAIENVNQGHDGGSGKKASAGAGGGGAGSDGGSPAGSGNGAQRIGGKGGDGRESDISGASVVYAGGGGGGSRTGIGGKAGAGGGAGASDGENGQPGTDGLGGGGGGGSQNKAGGKGGDGVIIVRLQEVMPEKPVSGLSLSYTGSPQTALPESPAYRREGTYEATKIGSYTARAILNDGYCWSDGTKDAVEIAWRIAQAKLKIVSVSVEDWRLGYPPKLPVIRTEPQVAVESLSVSYQYHKGSSETGSFSFKKYATWADLAAKIEELGAGFYSIRATLNATADYEVDDNEKKAESLPFEVWVAPEKQGWELGYRLPITGKGNVRLEVRENEPKGFHYEQVEAGGADLRVIDETGKQIPCKVTKWDTTGTSQIMVELPSGETTAYLCWGRLVDTADKLLDVGARKETQWQSTKSPTVGVLRVVDGARFYNDWSFGPKWNDNATSPTDMARALYGEVYYTVSGNGVLLTNTAPEKAGVYTVQFFVDAGSDDLKSWMGLKSDPIETQVELHSPYSDLKGTSDSATLAGRVLLANDDTAEPAVSGQAYSQTDDTAPVYWEHADVLALGVSFPLLNTPVNHTFAAAEPQQELCGAQTIWTLRNVRIGNLYLRTLAKRQALNYLPVSETGGVTEGDAAHLVLRNIDGAAIVSPCYSNGVGVVYFDAVNGFTQDATNGYRLVVEKLAGTNALAGVSEEDGRVWERVPLLSLPVVGGTFPAERPAETNVAELTVATGGSDRNFYRICAQVNERGLVRFRIRRTGVAPEFPSEPKGADRGGFILVDNILVSYPAMRADIEPCGFFDETLEGKSVVGQGGAWSVPFPSVFDTEVKARGRAVYTTNPGTPADTAAFLSSVKMQYRWRYLNQITNEWKDVYLDVGTLDSREDLDLRAPSGERLPGDVEFRYISRLNAPFYSYVDYSGLNIKLGELFTEEIACVTNALASPVRLASRGTDWFVRLREGQSDYASVSVAYRVGADTNEQFASLYVTDSGFWRGYVPVSTNFARKTLQYRFVLRDQQTPEAAEWSANTNILYVASATAEFPVSGVLSEGDTNSWSSLTLDGATGGYMFQMDASTRAVTVAHADYQNFNGWTDATGPYFKGTSETNDYKVGTSSKKRYYEERFTRWRPMSETDDAWQFADYYVTNNAGKVEEMIQIGEFDRATLGEWVSGPGKWVAKKYANPNSGVALQMQGSGKGYLTYASKEYAPRGLKKLSFNARLGQIVDPDYFAHVRDGSTLSNYTFFAAGVFDPKGIDNFRGDASISVIAYYRQYEGAYEARWEQVETNKQILSLYRWNTDNVNGGLISTLLKAWTNNTSWTFSKKGDRQPLFISARTDTDATWLQVAARQTQMADSSGNGSFTGTTDDWKGFVYKDTSADRLRSGEYGVISANCEAEFKQMAFHKEPTKMGGDNETWASGAVAFPSPSPKLSNATPEKGDWALRAGSLVYTNGLVKASVAPQKLSVYVKAPEAAAWPETPLWTTNLASFGNSPFEIPLYTTERCQVQFRVESKQGDPRVDIVLDTIELVQWAGNSWEDHSTADIPGYTRSGDTNFVFTHAWIVSNMSERAGILLSAKRTSPAGCSSIRAPLMDGRGGRGLGLGMLSFSYRDAQTNANLRLEIATNGYTESMLDSFSGWTTVTNFSFEGMSDLDRKSGQLSYYIGLHGVAGAMRLVVDTNTIARVAAETDPNLFGEVTITGISCYDEPALDDRSWWGWNLRMVSDNTNSLNAAEHDSQRIFLSDSVFGQSLALNNSVTLDTVENDKAAYPQNRPFVQTPTFQTNYIGEISFKARKYGYPTNDALYAQPASVVLRGAKDGNSPVWTELQTFVVSNDTYATYKYVTNPGEVYAAFRLEVSGVKDVQDPGGVIPTNYTDAVRVLLDEVFVSEAVRPRMGFRNVGAFRSDLSGTKRVPNVPSAEEQPLCGESWGVQCEVYGAQLPESIDFNREVKVRLYWYRGASPWGFENWRDRAETRSAELAPAADSNRVFRSSYETAPDAVADPISTSGSVVQYALEAVWYQKEDKTNPGASKIPQTNILTAADWQTPDWYRPVDFNAQYPEGFAAYTILDKVAPGWAWINEINVFGGYTSSWQNNDAQAQFIELAVPSGADLQDWALRLLEPQSSSKSVITNTLVRFGYAGAPTSKNLAYVQSNMTFVVVGSPAAEKNSYLTRDNGSLDAVWAKPRASTTVLGASGEISVTAPFALQLVRSSGIVEHELVALGTNKWDGMGYWGHFYSPTNAVNQMNKFQPGARYFYVGADDKDRAVEKPILSVTSSGYKGSGASLSVLYDHGETSNKWVNTAVATPGRVNDGQQIDPDAIPTPNGESIRIDATLNLTPGHIRQRIGDAGDFTNASRILYMKKGSVRGTNITYEVDNWYELRDVTTNGVASAVTTNSTPRQYSVTVGRGASNNVTVVATAQVDGRLRDLGLGVGNPYTPAIIDWLEKGTDVKGNPWPNAGSGEINLAEFHSLNGSFVTNLTLTTMYWLDMDPTTNGLWFVGGMAEPAKPIEHPITSGGGNVLTNLRMGVKLYMTNTQTAASWSPYVLRGLVPGSHSLNYATDPAWINKNWTSATFKVTGFLNNGHSSISNYTCWVPLRWFVFGADSFDSNHVSRIEVMDPFSPSSPTSYGGDSWANWPKDKNPAFYFWSLDTRIKPVAVEPLKQTNYYDWAKTTP